jgi:hypothetical protein
MPSTQKKYKLYKLYNAKQFFLKHRKKIKNQNFKLLNYKYLLIERKHLNIKKQSNNFCRKPKKKYVSYFYVIFQPNFFHCL